MGAASTFLLLDFDEVHGRVASALRAWIAGGELASWWTEAIATARRSGPDPSDRTQRWSDGRPLPVPERHLGEETQSAIELALLTATVGDGLAFGNARWIGIDLLDEYDRVLDPLPGSRLAAIIDQLDTNLLYANHGDGGFGEGVRGMLEPVVTAELDDALAAHGSRPVIGSAWDFRDAMCTIPAEPPNLCQPRWTLMALHSMAHLARQRNLGLLYGRDLAIGHRGTWHTGVFESDHSSGYWNTSSRRTRNTRAIRNAISSDGE